MIIMRQIDAKQEKYIDHSPCQNSPCQKLHPYFTNLQTYPFLLFFLVVKFVKNCTEIENRVLVFKKYL